LTLTAQWSGNNNKANYAFSRSFYWRWVALLRIVSLHRSDSAAKIKQEVMDTFTKWTNYDCTSDREGFCEYESAKVNQEGKITRFGKLIRSSFVSPQQPLSRSPHS
jgi:hypothetical protein